MLNIVKVDQTNIANHAWRNNHDKIDFEHSLTTSTDKHWNHGTLQARKC
jgi:hypothetical protein